MNINWGLGIEHEMRVRFQKNISEIPESIKSKFLKNVNSKYIFVNSELLLYYFYLYEINFSHNFAIYNSNDFEYLKILTCKKNLYKLAKEGKHYPINNVEYNNEELINYYVFFYCLYQCPLCFLNYNFKNEDNIKIGFSKIPTFDDWPHFLEKLYNKTFEKSIYDDLLALKNNYKNNSNVKITKHNMIRFYYDIEYNNQKTVSYIKRPRVIISLENFNIEKIYKFVENFKKTYSDNKINFTDSKLLKSLYLLYKNRIPEIDLSDKTTSIEFKTIQYKNINYEKTLDDLINLESSFFKALSLIPIFKYYIKYFGPLNYHNIGSINKSILINDLIFLGFSDVQEDYTGSYHLWITCPYNKNLSMTDFLKIHESLGNKLQLLEPIFLAHFGSPSYEVLENKSLSKSSFRHFLNKYSNYGTTDVSLINGQKKSIVSEYFFSEEDIIKNRAFIPNQTLLETVYIYDENENEKKKYISNKNNPKNIKIDYNYLNTRSITNNLFSIFDKGDPQSNKDIYIKNYMTLLFEETNIRPRTSFGNDNQKYYLKLGADIRTRDYERFFYPLDEDIWIPKILVHNNKFIEVYYDQENKKISYKRIYKKNIYEKQLAEERIGIEFRILDHFPTYYLSQILSILGSIVINSLSNRKNIPLKKLHIAQQFWHNEMFEVIKKGYEYKLSHEYIKEINKEFSINIRHTNNTLDTTLFLSEFYNNMDKKYEKNVMYEKLRFSSIINFKSFNRIAWFEILNSYFNKNPFLYKKLLANNLSNINFNNLINIINKKNNLNKFKNYIKNLKIENRK